MRALALLIFLTSATYIILDPPQSATGYVARHAIQQPGFWDLLVSGTAAEKHDFAHGKWTKYGSLPFDADSYLRSSGFSEKQVHDLGFTLGFSKKWER